MTQAHYLRASREIDAASRDDDHEFSPFPSPQEPPAATTNGGYYPSVALVDGAAQGGGPLPNSSSGSSGGPPTPPQPPPHPRSPQGGVLSNSPPRDAPACAPTQTSLPGFALPPSPTPHGPYSPAAAASALAQSWIPQSQSLQIRLRGVWEQLVPHFSGRLDATFSGAADGSVWASSAAASGDSPAAALLSLHGATPAAFWRLVEAVLRPYAEKPLHAVVGTGGRVSLSFSVGSTTALGSAFPPGSAASSSTGGGGAPRGPARIRAYPDSSPSWRHSDTHGSSPFTIAKSGSRKIWERTNRVAAVGGDAAGGAVRDRRRDLAEALSAAAAERLLALETVR